MGVRLPARRHSVPQTQASAKAVFDGIPQDEIDLMTHQNAEALFHFPLSQELVAQYQASA